MTPLSKSKNLLRFATCLLNDIVAPTLTYEQVYLRSIDDKVGYLSALETFLGTTDLSPWQIFEAGLHQHVANRTPAIYCLSQDGLLAPHSAKSILEKVECTARNLLERAAHKKTLILYRGDTSLSAVVLYLATIKSGLEWLAVSNETGVEIIAKTKTLFSQHQILEFGDSDAEKVVIDSLGSNRGAKQVQDLSQTARIHLSTSGTTGLPKIVTHSRGAILNQLKEHTLHLDQCPKDKILFLTHPAWMMWNWSLTALAAGVSVALVPSVSYLLHRSLRDSCHKLKIDCFGTSTFYVHRFRAATHSKFPMNPRKIVLTGGQVTAAILEKLEGICGSYDRSTVFSISGGTEVNGCFFFETLDHPKITGKFQCMALGVGLKSDPTSEPIPLVIDSRIPNLPLKIRNLDGQETLGRSLDVERHELAHGDLITKDDLGFQIHGRTELIFKSKGQRISLDFLLAMLEGRFFESGIAVPFEVAGDSVFCIFHTGFINSKNEEAAVHHISQTLGSSYLPELFVQVTAIPSTPSLKKAEAEMRSFFPVTCFTDASSFRQTILKNVETYESTKREIQE